MWETFIEYRLYPTYIFELIAVLAALFYLHRNKNAKKADRLIVFTMILIFVIDLSAVCYSVYVHVYDFAHIEFLEDTPFSTHFWMYNILTLITGSLFALYFLMQTNSANLKKIIGVLMAIYIISSIIHFFINEVFFLTTSAYVYIFGAFLICISIAFYYLDLLRTDRILNFRRELPLYISVGLIIYQLGITPLFIFQRYIGGDDDFQVVYSWTIDFANLFLYSVFTFAFIKTSLEINSARGKILR